MQFTNNAYQQQAQFVNVGQQHPMFAHQHAQFVYTSMDMNQMQPIIQLPLQVPAPNSVPMMAPLPFQQEHLMLPVQGQNIHNFFSNHTPCYVDPQTGYLTPCRSRSSSIDGSHSPNAVPIPCEEKLPELSLNTYSDNYSDKPALLDTTSSGPQKKYAYRSKQRKIDKVRSQIEEEFQEMGLFADEKELVRGDDTVRVHVKTFLGLTKITEFLNEVKDHKEIAITRIACPFSKKNKNQKKGFIVYLKVATVDQMLVVKDGIFPKYEEVLKSCVVAKPREPVEEKLGSMSMGLAPPMMLKAGSFGA